MFGKTHTSFALYKLSKPGNFYPMFGQTQSLKTKIKIYLAKSKSPIGLYNIDNNLIYTYLNLVELAKFLMVNKNHNR